MQPFHSGSLGHRRCDHGLQGCLLFLRQAVGHGFRATKTIKTYFDPCNNSISLLGQCKNIKRMVSNAANRSVYKFALIYASTLTRCSFIRNRHFHIRRSRPFQTSRLSLRNDVTKQEKARTAGDQKMEGTRSKPQQPKPKRRGPGNWLGSIARRSWQQHCCRTSMRAGGGAQETTQVSSAIP